MSTGAGTVSGGNVTNVTVICSNNAYSVGGTVSGLVGSMELQDNNGDNLTVAANGAFTFATQVANGSPYSVTVFTQPAGQSCSVASGTGTIALANVANVTVTCATNTHTIGGTVTGLNGNMVLQDNGGDNLTVSTNGSFTFATAVAEGNLYNVSVLTQPITGQTCTVTGGSGTASANVTTVVVNCVKNTTPRFAYVANYGTNDVSAYTINASTGTLTSVGAVVAAGTGPHSVTVDPSGKFAYVANWSSNNVSAYTINASTGVLTPVGTVATATKPFSVTVDPTGKFAYVANYGDGVAPSTVSAYTIDSTGALTAVAGSPFGAGIAPSSVTVDPTGKFAYVANQGSNDVSAYTINASTGALTSVGAAMATGTTPNSVTVDPSGKFAYVANTNSAPTSRPTPSTPRPGRSARSSAVAPVAVTTSRRGRIHSPSPSTPQASSPTWRITAPPTSRPTLSTPAPGRSPRLSAVALAEVTTSRRGRIHSPSPSTPRASSPTWRIGVPTMSRPIASPAPGRLVRLPAVAPAAVTTSRRGLILSPSPPPARPSSPPQARNTLEERPRCRGLSLCVCMRDR